MENMDTPTFVAAIQSYTDLDQNFKNIVINHVKDLFQKCQLLQSQNEMYKKLNDSKEESLDFAKQLVENQQRKILEYQMEYENVDLPSTSTPMDQTPTPNAPAGPTIVQEGINGIVKSFCVNQRRGIIEFKLNESDEDVKEAVVFANNISNSDIEKPDHRTLRPKENAVFDLCDIGHGTYSARNVSGPDGKNVQGYYVKVKVIYRDYHQNSRPRHDNHQTQRSNRSEHRANYHQTQYRNPSQPRSLPIHPSQSQYYQQTNNHRSNIRTPSRTNSTAYRNQSQNYRQNNTTNQQQHRISNFRPQRQY